MDRRDGRRVRFRRDFSAGTGGATAKHLFDRRWAHARVRDPAVREWVWRSASMELAVAPAVHLLLFSQLPQISSLTALSADDAGAGSDAARLVGTRHGAHVQAISGLWASAPFLLPASSSFDSCARGPLRIDALWPGRLALWQPIRHAYNHPIRQWIWPAGGLFHLGGGRSDALSSLLLVRRPEATKQKSLAQLSLGHASRVICFQLH